MCLRTAAVICKVDLAFSRALCYPNPCRPRDWC
jgi:hypothetical protein